MDLSSYETANNPPRRVMKAPRLIPQKVNSPVINIQSRIPTASIQNLGISCASLPTSSNTNLPTSSSANLPTSSNMNLPTSCISTNNILPSIALNKLQEMATLPTASKEELHSLPVIMASIGINEIKNASIINSSPIVAQTSPVILENTIPLIENNNVTLAQRYSTNGNGIIKATLNYLPLLFSGKREGDTSAKKDQTSIKPENTLDAFYKIPITTLDDRISDDTIKSRNENGKGTKTELLSPKKYVVPNKFVLSEINKDDNSFISLEYGEIGSDTMLLTGNIITNPTSLNSIVKLYFDKEFIVKLRDAPDLYSFCTLLGTLEGPKYITSSILEKDEVANKWCLIPQKVCNNSVLGLTYKDLRDMLGIGMSVKWSISVKGILRIVV